MVGNAPAVTSVNGQTGAVTVAPNVTLGSDPDGTPVLIFRVDDEGCAARRRRTLRSGDQRTLNERLHREHCQAPIVICENGPVGRAAVRAPDGERAANPPRNHQAHRPSEVATVVSSTVATGACTFTA